MSCAACGEGGEPTAYVCRSCESRLGETRLALQTLVDAIKASVTLRNRLGLEMNVALRGAERALARPR